MRWLALAVLACSTPAAADGVYVFESLGGASFQGDLRQYSTGSPRASIGAGYRHGVWALEVSGVWHFAEDFFAIDCYSEEECAAIAAPDPEMRHLAIDVRRTWRVIHSPVSKHFGVDLSLHGGPRRYDGLDALDRFAGYGVGGGAQFDLNLKVFSAFVDFGTDVAVLSHPDADTILARLPYVMVGGRLGWM